MTSLPGPVWYFVSPTPSRGTIGELVAGMAMRGEKLDPYWQIGAPPAWSMARALKSAPLVGPIGFRERIARGASASAEKRVLALSRPDARWCKEPWIRGPDASVSVVLRPALERTDSDTFATLADPSAWTTRLTAAVVPLGSAMTAQASIVFAALATLEAMAPGGVAWFNHELLCDQVRERDRARPGQVLFATAGLTLAEVARREESGCGPFV